MTAEGSKNLVEVGRDGDLVVEEILEPEIIFAVGQGDQGQQISQADLDGRFLSLNVEIILRQGIDTKMRGHC